MIIEEVVRDYLDEQLTVPVLLQRTEKPAVPYVVIEKTGGGQTNRINSATIAVQSYAGGIHAASSLNEQVKAVMDGIVELSEVSNVSLNSDYNFTDEERDEYRYQAVFELTHY